MRIIRVLMAVAMPAISFSTCAADISKTFTPSPGVAAVVEVKGSNLVWRLSGKNGIKQDGVSLDTEKTPRIEIGSYDFSGRLGFLVSHIDDGMGTYEVDRVFTFSPSSNEFVERSPSCGDGFVNLRVYKKRRYLVSTYWDQNIPKICVTRLSIAR
ncbi:hypothetical protein RI103_00270 [Paraburkholderia sp. FT54]|uniref:hypothetical protein n=1 Tax=Paraburkholderia sp. FT54 TaxID=3074437 RepID=UPI002877A3D7|nr:hypothetical protein [Paraburkholderia sp. FT54]WNC89832.1 hypothetical protein RI103_00270 [Paraburkholderia sp. FT54]